MPLSIRFLIGAIAFVGLIGLLFGVMDGCHEDIKIGNMTMATCKR